MDPEQVDASPQRPVSCDHCGAALASGDPHPFCCQGCRMAHGIIAACGLQAFHRLKTGTSSIRPTSIESQGAWFDSDDFARHHVRTLATGHASIRWQVEGIHCAACVWLLERLPTVNPGILAARVDLADDALITIHDPRVIRPAGISGVVASLGYRLRPRRSGDADSVRRRSRRQDLLRMAVSAASAVGSMHLSLNVLIGGIDGDMEVGERTWYGALALLAALPALTWGALPFFRGARASWRMRMVTVDMIVAAVVLVATVAGLVGVIRGSGDLYVDAAAMFVSLLLAGRFAARAAKDAALRRLGPGQGLLPDHVGLVDGTGKVSQVGMETVSIGALLRVEVEGIVPADGVIHSGSSGVVSTAVLTGESRSVSVREGDRIWAGSRCLAGPIDLEVSAVGESSRVGSLLATANRARPPTGRASQTEKLLSWFAPTIPILAAITGITWWYLDPSRALDQALALVLVACPCAIGLAAPLAASLATMRAARQGILLRDPGGLEALTRIQQVVFDKTGTLTSGRPAIVEWVQEATLSQVADILALAARSRHPLAAAVAVHLESQGIRADGDRLRGWSEEPGQGITASTDHGQYRFGSPAHAGIDWFPADPQATPVVASLDGRPILRVALSDPIQAGAREFLSVLQGRKITVMMASGDRPETVLAVARQVGIPADHAFAACSPEGKAHLIDRLQKTNGPTVMVGDGVNDAAALAKADIGIGMQGGLISCLDTCTAVVLSGRITGLASLWTGAMDVRRTVRRCLIVSVLYNVIGMALVMAGAIGPVVCAVAMPLSSLTVLIIAWKGRAFQVVRSGV